MNPIALAALDRARHPAHPAHPAATVVKRSPEPVPQTLRPLPMPAAIGPINHFMRTQARKEARDLVTSFSAELGNQDGLVLVTNALKRAAIGRPGSHVQGFVDVILWLEVNVPYLEMAND